MAVHVKTLELVENMKKVIQIKLKILKQQNREYLEREFEYFLKRKENIKLVNVDFSVTTSHYFAFITYKDTNN